MSLISTSKSSEILKYHCNLFKYLETKSLLNVSAKSAQGNFIFFEESEISRFHCKFVYYLHVLQRQQSLPSVPAKSAHGDFIPLKSQGCQSFITILLSISKCYRDSKVL